jgi:hypothetical protein
MLLMQVVGCGLDVFLQHSVDFGCFVRRVEIFQTARKQEEQNRSQSNTTGFAIGHNPELNQFVIELSVNASKVTNDFLHGTVIGAETDTAMRWTDHSSISKDKVNTKNYSFHHGDCSIRRACVQIRSR